MALGFISAQGDRATIGAATIGAQADMIIGGVYPSPPTGGVGAWVVTELGCFCENSGAGAGAGTFHMAIYEVDGVGDLDDFKGGTEGQAPKDPPQGTPAWVGWTGLSITIDGSTDYGIVVWTDDANFDFEEGFSGGEGLDNVEYKSSESGQYSWPDLAGGTTNFANREVCVYAVYEAASGGALTVDASQPVIIVDDKSLYIDPLIISVSQDIIISDNDTVQILIPTITRVGTYDLHQDNATEIPVTIPTDAQICVVCITGWNNNTPAGPMVNKLNWDDDTGVVDFTHIIRAGSEADGTKTRAEAWYMLSSDVNWPGSGSQNIYWDTAKDFEQGFNFVVLFYKGLNMTSPIVDTDYRDGPGGNWTSSLDNVGSRDMTIGCAYSTTEEGGAVADVDPGGSGQTAIVESSAYTSAFIAVGEELDEGAFVIGVG